MTGTLPAVGCAAALGVIVLAIVLARLPPFLAIMLGAGAFVWVAGLPFAASVKAFSVGAGGIFGEVGLVIALGAMLGGLMTASGAADRVVQALLGRVSGRALPWAVAACAMLVGLPLFFEVGLVVMLPIILSLARQTGRPVMGLALPAMAGMTVLHALVPPHPGPLIGVSVLHADLGLTMLLGLGIAVPAVALAGPVYARFVAGRIGTVAPPEIAAASQPSPPLSLSLLVLLLPVLLMLGRTIGRIALPQGAALTAVLESVGEPVMAMAITVLVAVGLLFWVRGQRPGALMEEALGPIAGLLMTIGAGSGLKGVLLAGGLAEAIGRWAAGAAMPPVLLVWGDRAVPAPGDRLGDGGDGDHRGADRADGAASGASRSAGGPACVAAGVGDRRRLGVLLPRQRCRLLDGAGVLRARPAADGAGLVGVADHRLRGRAAGGLAAVGGAVATSRRPADQGQVSPGL